MFLWFRFVIIYFMSCWLQLRCEAQPAEEREQLASASRRLRPARLHKSRILSQNIRQHIPSRSCIAAGDATFGCSRLRRAPQQPKVIFARTATKNRFSPKHIVYYRRNVFEPLFVTTGFAGGYRQRSCGSPPPALCRTARTSGDRIPNR